MYHYTYSTFLFGLLLAWSNGFHHHHERKTMPVSSSVLFHDQRQNFHSEKDYDIKISSFFRNRLDTLSAAGLENVRTAGGGVYIFGIQSLVKRAKALPQVIENLKNLPQDIRHLTWKDVKPIKRVKSLHGPITYIILSFFLAKRYNSLLKNMIFWLWNAFCIKWFRARYVFKIPVWDRQPNWNNVITSKEQEKDLKAFTCKTCGSTLFIAKTREFFFEGTTGIGGLGCFSCGVKGADNFVMDRDRIVEDVADIDDYFEYEMPLDFISAAERRALLKEAGGDEDKANKILIERDNTKASEKSQTQVESIVNDATITVVNDEISEAVAKEDEEEITSSLSAADDEESEEVASSVQATEESVALLSDNSTVESERKTTKLPSSKRQKSSPSSDSDIDEDLDLLDMDDF